MGSSSNTSLYILLCAMLLSISLAWTLNQLTSQTLHLPFQIHTDLCKHFRSTQLCTALFYHTSYLPHLNTVQPHITHIRFTRLCIIHFSITKSSPTSVPPSHQSSPGLARTICIRCVYGVFGRETTKFMVIYGVSIWFWPALVITHFNIRSPTRSLKRGGRSLLSAMLASLLTVTGV